MEIQAKPVTQYAESMDEQVKEFYFDFAREFKLEDKFNRPEEFTQLFDRVRSCVKPRTKYRAVKNLGVIVLYIFLKTRGTLIPLPEILRHCQLSYGNFVTGLRSVTARYLVFNARNKKDIVESYVTSILKNFQLEEKVIQNALLLLEYCYPLIQFAKEEVNAAVVCTLTLIALGVKGIPMSEICEQAGVQQSNLGKHISESIVPRIGVKNYISLLKSSDSIRKALELKVELLKVNNRSFNVVRLVKTKSFKKPSPLISKVLELRHENASLEDISQMTNLTPYKVQRILERKL